MSNGGNEPADSLADWYDQDTLARIDATLAAYDAKDAAVEANRPAPPSARQAAAGLAITAAALTGVRQVTEPSQKEIFEDVDPGIDTDTDQFVTIYLVPNDPKASRAVVRPWLAPSVLDADTP